MLNAHIHHNGNIGVWCLMIMTAIHICEVIPNFFTTFIIIQLISTAVTFSPCCKGSKTDIKFSSSSHGSYDMKEKKYNQSKFDLYNTYMKGSYTWISTP